MFFFPYSRSRQIGRPVQVYVFKYIFQIVSVFVSRKILLWDLESSRVAIYTLVSCFDKDGICGGVAVGYHGLYARLSFACKIGA